jgi:hypothetical protein
VKPTEPTANPTSTPKMGPFATLRAFLHVDGTTAPKISRRAGLPLALLLTLSAALALAASPASAAEETRVLESSFGPDGTAATAFEAPDAVGVDQSTGQIYVADAQAKTVRRFNSAHEPEPFTGIAENIKSGVLTGFAFYPAGGIDELAVDSNPLSPSFHDFYVVNNDSGTSPRSVRAFQSDGEPANFTKGPGAGTNEIGGLSYPCGVAVDANGDIYASDYHEGVQVFAPSGEHITTIANTVESTFCNAAVDSHGVLYLNHFRGAVEKFTPSEFPVTTATTYGAGGVVDENAAAGVAVDPATNHLLVDESTQVTEYDETGAFLFISFGALTASHGLAVNGATKHVYVSDTAGDRRVGVFSQAGVFPKVKTGEASAIKATSATLNGTVNPEEVAVTDCHFEFVPQQQFEEEKGFYTGVTAQEKAPCEEPNAAEIGSGSGAVAVHAKITGLAVNTTYHFRLQASNVSGTVPGQDATFPSAPPPAITGAEATALTATSATLNANVNPGGIPLKDCHFEYGTTTAYGSPPVPCAPAAGEIPADKAAHAVSAAITPLFANTPYHWRIVAESEAGTTTSVDHTFVYQTTGEGLPDNRAYEMVTPPQKNGGLIGNGAFDFEPGISEGPEGLHKGPSRVIAMTIQCFAPSESCTGIRNSTGEPFAFTRTDEARQCEPLPSPCWATTALAPPATRFSTNSVYLRGADEGTVLFSMPTGPAEEDEWYARLPEGSFVPFGPATPPGQTGVESFAQQAQSVTADLSHLVFVHESTTGVQWPFDKTTGSLSLYEYVGAHNTEPMLVGVSNEGPPPWKPGATHVNEGADLVSVCGTELAGYNQKVPHANVSPDGRIVYFTAQGHTGCFGSGANEGKEVPVDELFARVDGELPSAHTVAISQPKALNPAAVNKSCETTKCKEDTENPAPAVNPNWRGGGFAGASEDGSKVFFLDPQRLTDRATEGAGNELGCSDTSECNLYLYDFAQPEGERLLDVSAPETGGEKPLVQGVVQVSADGSHVYFVARGKLAGNRSVLGSEAVAGEDNLYVFDTYTRHTAFIATVPDSDHEQWRNGRSGNVTPDGRFLVFASNGALTPDARAGGTQIYRYDAAGEQLVRVSVGNDGFNDNGNAGTGRAFIAGPSEGSDVGPTRGDPTMSHDGSRVFFQSPVALTPHALNDVIIGHAGTVGQVVIYAQNVYEWHAGHVYLISDGRDTSTAETPCKGNSGSSVCLLGADASGANVFFTTADRLVPQDTDTQVDIYDARVCEPEQGNPCITEPPRRLPPCGGEACHGIPAATPSNLTPGTASFNGEGNVTPPPPSAAKPLTNAQKLAKALKACRTKHNKHKRAACEKQARKKYGATKAKKSAKRASHDRRASR